MALIISTHGNSAFRTEELEGVFRIKNEKTHKFDKYVILQFKSGAQTKIACKTCKEALELYSNIVEIMKKDIQYTVKYEYHNPLFKGKLPEAL